MMCSQQVSPPVASLGYWANRDMPLTTDGALTKDLDDITVVHCSAAKPRSKAARAAVARARGTEQERLVLCEQAKELAEVGENIRWSVVLEATAQLPCALGSTPLCNSQDGSWAKTAGLLSKVFLDHEEEMTHEGPDSEKDECSTSASGGDAADSTGLSSEGEGEDAVEDALQGGRPRGTLGDRVYPVALLLQVYGLCQTSRGASPAMLSAKELPPKDMPPPPGLAPPQIGAKQPRLPLAEAGRLRNAPWRSQRAAPRLGAPPGL